MRRAPSSAAPVRSTSIAAEPTHIFILSHGLAGTPRDLTVLTSLLSANPRVLVHNVKANASLNSFDGIPAGANRLADEVRGVVQQYPSLRFISFVGNSLGGVYCRYAIALLLDNLVDEAGRAHPGYVAGTEEIIRSAGGRRIRVSVT